MLWMLINVKRPTSSSAIHHNASVFQMEAKARYEELITQNLSKIDSSGLRRM